MAPFKTQFPTILSQHELDQLAAESQRIVASGAVMTTLGESNLHLVTQQDWQCFEWQVNRLYGKQIVYGARRVSDTVFKRYAGTLLHENGAFSIRISEKDNGLPDVELHAGPPLTVAFPMVGFEYQFMVHSTAYMRDVDRVKQAQLAAANAQIAQLQQQLLVAAGSHQPSVAQEPTGGGYLQGYDCDLPFNLWDPCSYGAVLALGPTVGIMTIIARLDGAVGYGRSSDPVLRSLFETCEAALTALAAERQPFASRWPFVVGKMLARLRDCVTVKDGKDPHLARFKMLKEDGFDGVDAFAAQVMQQRRGGNRGRGSFGRGGDDYYRSSSPNADRWSKGPSSFGGRGSSGYGGRGNGRGTSGY